MIDIKNLTFGYQRKNILFDNMNISIPSGSIYGLLGKNGAGKTTLLKQIAGLLNPGDGECMILGQHSRLRLPSVLSNVFLIPEEFELPQIKITTFVQVHAPFYPGFDKDLFEKYLDEFQVKGDPKITTMSYGQKKKFLIAFGLATCTRILLLDEPTNGLDIPSKSQFRKIIASSMNDEKIILISTHQVRDLASLIDNIVILENGKILFNRSIAEISSKVSFAQTNDLTDLDILYSEDILGGKSVIYIKNSDETDIDIELLFNGVVFESEKFNNIFKN